jgi:hypothetical protein
MSSVTSAFAQVDRRIGYFICVSGSVQNYDVSQSTVDYNSWNVNTLSTYPQGTVLEDMGEIAKYQGSILRKVRAVTAVPGGGAASTAWIVVPGGEYPMAGYGTSATTAGLTPAIVARLG